MPTDTSVNNLIINKLTKAQYDGIQTKSDTELYLVPDIIDSAPTSGSSNTVTSGGVYSALIAKQDKTQLETISGTTLSAQTDKYYVGTNVGTLTVTLPTPIQNTLQSIVIYLETGSTPNITFTGGTILYGRNFVIEANTKFELNILWNGVAWILGQLKLYES